MVERLTPTPAQHVMLAVRADFAWFLHKVATIQPPARPIRKHRVCLCGYTRPKNEKDV